MEWWPVVAGFNAAIAGAYYAIAWLILSPIAKAWAHTPKDKALAVAVCTGMIFLTCATGHLAHLSHIVGVFDPPDVTAGSRAAAGWHLAAVDGTTAVVGFTYWMLRKDESDDKLEVPE